MLRFSNRFVAMLLASLTLLGALVMPVAASAQDNSEAAHLCQDGGYLNYTDAVGGEPFSTTGECVRFAAQGNQLVTVKSATVSFIAQPSNAFGFTCSAELIVSGYELGDYTVQFSPYTTSTAFDKPLAVGDDGSGSVSSLDGSSKFTYGPVSPPVSVYIDSQLVAIGDTTPKCSLD